MAGGWALSHHHGTGANRGMKIDSPIGLTKILRERISAYLAARTERKIERYIQEHGGELTDELEREISRRYCGSSSRSWL